jgi:hypothetical protein
MIKNIHQKVVFVASFELEIGKTMKVVLKIGDNSINGIRLGNSVDVQVSHEQI